MMALFTMWVFFLGGGRVPSPSLQNYCGHSCLETTEQKLACIIKIISNNMSFLLCQNVKLDISFVNMFNISVITMIKCLQSIREAICLYVIMLILVIALSDSILQCGYTNLKLRYNITIYFMTLDLVLSLK